MSQSQTDVTDIDPADYRWIGEALSILREHGYSPDKLQISKGKIRLIYDPEEWSDSDD